MILVIFGFLSCLFLYFAWQTSRSKKPVSLWANGPKEIQVKDPKSYNQACAKLLAVYSVLLFLSGLLVAANHIFTKIAGYLAMIFSSLLLIIIYTFIETKHRHK